MITSNAHIEVTVDPTADKSVAQAEFYADGQPALKVYLDAESATDQFEDILNKFTCFAPEWKTVIWRYMSNFIKSKGYKIIEDGVVKPQ